MNERVVLLFTDSFIHAPAMRERGYFVTCIADQERARRADQERARRALSDRLCNFLAQTKKSPHGGLAKSSSELLSRPPWGDFAFLGNRISPQAKL